MTDSGSGSPAASASSHFAWMRTRMAAERTLMAWARTAVSMIGFGFTIVQFFDKLGAMQGVAEAARPQAPRFLGLALIGCGVAALMISVWQYRKVLAHLSSGSYGELAGLDGSTLRTPTYAVAWFLILVGLFAFGAVYLRAF